jgi:CheY-like chemotaxis protein
MTIQKTLRAIVADDERSLREDVARRINKIAPGTQVDAVINGKELVEAIRRKEYDFVVVDNNMPEMDGVKATKSIRDSGYKGPICMYTGRLSIINDAKDAGATDFVLKDNLDHLNETIAKYAGVKYQYD